MSSRRIFWALIARSTDRSRSIWTAPKLTLVWTTLRNSGRPATSSRVPLRVDWLTIRMSAHMVVVVVMAVIRHRHSHALHLQPQLVVLQPRPKRLRDGNFAGGGLIVQSTPEKSYGKASIYGPQFESVFISSVPCLVSRLCVMN